MSYSKNYICKFMQVNSWHHKLFHFYLSFWIWKVWKGSEKITKIWISWERKEHFGWNKQHFSWFLKGFIWWKNKNLIKNSGHKLAVDWIPLIGNKAVLSLVQKLTCNYNSWWENSNCIPCIPCTHIPPYSAVQIK